MVRHNNKSKTTTSPSSSSNNSESSSSNENEKRTLIILSFPIVMIFNLLKTILFELFIVLKFVYNSSSRILNKPAKAEVNLETVKADEVKDSMDLLQMQKNHHKKAFEFISQALKIDESQTPGENEFVIAPKFLREFQLWKRQNPLMMTHRCFVHMSNNKRRNLSKGYHEWTESVIFGKHSRSFGANI